MSIRKILNNVAIQNREAAMLWCGGKLFTYSDALRFTAYFEALGIKNRNILLISDKTPEAYFTIFASLILENTYIPANKNWNTSRIESILEQTIPEFVICDLDWAASHEAILQKFRFHALSNNDQVGNIVKIYVRDDNKDCKLERYKAEKKVADLLYVMFTSGSTGIPKGVPVSRENADHYVKSMISTFELEGGEKWIQAVELNFDLSVHDILLAWGTAGCIVAIPASQSPMGPRFVRKLNVQNWLSVPSSASRSISLGLLKENTMPSLKRSFFCGEALPEDIALAWKKAAPNAPVYNIYGPTEATIAFSWYEFKKNLTTNAIVKIGRPLPGLEMKLSKENEILLCGPQIFAGYLSAGQSDNDCLTTGAAGKTWYRTGDKGSIDADGNFSFQGRLDWQVKIRGNRIEIGEVEQAIRKCMDCGLAFVVPVLEVAPGSYDDLYAFVDVEVDSGLAQQALSKFLPVYMIPKYFYTLAEFPINANGKIDRKKLIDIAERNRINLEGEDRNGK